MPNAERVPEHFVQLEDSHRKSSPHEKTAAGPPRLRRHLVPAADGGAPLVRYERLPPEAAAADHESE
eukprot:1328567-Prymnesium_polylepis.1